MYSAMIDNHGDTRCYTTTKDYAFVIDTEGNGANPVDTLLAGLCGCLGHWVRDFLRSEGTDNPGFTVKADGTPTDDRRRLARIEVEIGLKGAGLDESRRGELAKHMENCILYNTLKANSPIDIVVKG
jgi:uncharacterized OsmC-like protein